MRSTVLFSTLLFLPTACHHSAGGGAGLGAPTGPPPILSGQARYQDLNRDGLAGPGDRVVLGFNAPIKVNTADPAALSLPLEGDTFGAGATLVAGPGLNEVSVLLGIGARLRSRGRYVEGIHSYGAPSGIGVAEDAPEGAIEHANTGVDVQGGVPTDLFPEPVPGVLSGLGPSARHVATADLNRDGRDDLIMANGTGGVDVYESLATGGYSALNLPAGDAREVLAVNLKGAGRVDLVVLNADQLITFENLSPAGGSITLGTLEVHDLPDLITTLDHIDIDHDGDRDVLLAGAGGIWVYENQAGALLAPAAPLLGGPAGGRDLAVGDVNRDGWEDVLVALPGQNLLLRSVLCSHFQLVAQGQGDSSHVALVDLNRDGRLDAVSAGEGPIEVWYGVTGDIFEPAYDLPAGTVTGMAVEDLDGDGAPDLLVSDGLETRLLANDGQGQLLETGVILEGADGLSLALADVDGDGDRDLALAGSSMPQVWSASRVGTWGAPRVRESSLTPGTGILFSMALADFDGDARLDLASARSQRIELRQGLEGAQFGPPTVLSMPASRAQDLVFGDVDGDGDLDLAAAILGDAGNLWLGDGAGNFASSSIAGDPGQHRETAVALGDLNGDGFPELVLGTVGGWPDQIWFNGGGSCEGGPAANGYWFGYDPIPVDLPGTASTLDIALADVDLDGDLDLLTAHGGDQPDRLFLNDGLGNMTLSAQAFPARDTQSLTLADVDRDGDPDLVAGMPGGNLLFHGNGVGGFGAPVALDGIATFSAQLVALDGDSLPDLLIGNEQSHGWRAMLGTPDGLFSEGTGQWAPSLSIRVLVAGDLDRDGAIDFVTGASSEGVPSRVWLSR
jgi:FG-GAP-like repeat